MNPATVNIRPLTLVQTVLALETMPWMSATVFVSAWTPQTVAKNAIASIRAGAHFVNVLKADFAASNVRLMMFTDLPFFFCFASLLKLE